MTKPATSPGASSASSGTGCQVVTVCPFECTCASRDSAGITLAVVVAGSAATTSIEEISGAAARMASSTASSNVTADDGQLLQLPLNASRTTSSAVTSSKSTSPPWEPR